MECTWLALAASLMLGLGAACGFVFAVKRGYFRDIEDAKCQIFWSDLEELVDTSKGTEDGRHAESKPEQTDAPMTRRRLTVRM